jgi:predicted transcriptional regulator
MTTILSVSLPDDLRVQLDAEAKRQQRTRSFVVAEAVRAYLAGADRDAFTSARDRTLREALALSPADRVRLSESLWREFARHRPQTTGWTASFNTFAEYEEWRRSEGGRGT